jgi:hypothetical protein
MGWPEVEEDADGWGSFVSGGERGRERWSRAMEGGPEDELGRKKLGRRKEKEKGKGRRTRWAKREGEKGKGDEPREIWAKRRRGRKKLRGRAPECFWDLNVLNFCFCFENHTTTNKTMQRHECIKHFGKF